MLNEMLITSRKHLPRPTRQLPLENRHPTGYPPQRQGFRRRLRPGTRPAQLRRRSGYRHELQPRVRSRRRLQIIRIQGKRQEEQAQKQARRDSRRRVGRPCAADWRARHGARGAEEQEEEEAAARGG